MVAVVCYYKGQAAKKCDASIVAIANGLPFFYYQGVGIKTLAERVW